MKAFGFLSFGHYGSGRGPGDPSARDMLHEADTLVSSIGNSRLQDLLREQGHGSNG